MDLDSQDAIKWFISQFNTLPPKTLNVSTGRGAHYYFRYPEGADLSKVEPRENVELIGNKHYVVAPGSVHPSGREYKSNGVGELADLPEWVVGYIGRSKTKTKGDTASNQAKISSQDKLEPVGDVKTDPETIRDILDHSVFNGPAKTGSNNGRFLTRIITCYNLGLDQSTAIEVTKAKYPNLSSRTIRDSARATYKREYGLSVERMVDLGISQDAAEDLFAEVVATAGWRGKVREDDTGYMDAQEFNERIFKATFVMTLAGYTRTTYGELAAIADVSKSTLAQKDKTTLPELVEIEASNGNGLRIANYLPFILQILTYAILTSLTARATSITNSLSSNALKDSGSLGGVVKGEVRENEEDQKRGPPE